MTSLTIHRSSHIEGNVRSLPSSKSLSNRALLIDALTGHRCQLTNLSSARDTRLMEALVRSPETGIDVRDAGTAMRFLTAYFAVTGQHKIITGTPRMKERPIHLLVNALRSLGASIEYGENDGFPPVEVKGFGKQQTSSLSVRGDVSSQFISALMMIAPVLPEGLTIRLTGKVGSWPYLHMTAELMRKFGASVELGREAVVIQPGGYRPGSYRVEPDWSAASYWFAIAALAESANILLPGVTTDSLQGDRVIETLMEPLGVKAEFIMEGLRLTRKQVTVSQVNIDFSDCPDLAQTILPVCASLQVMGTFSGMESLRIKETDRIEALRCELAQLGAQLTESDGVWTLVPGKQVNEHPFIRTYHDHRMAMGFAPLATRMDVTIEEPDVVNKSYPGFWEDLASVRFLSKRTN